MKIFLLFFMTVLVSCGSTVTMVSEWRGPNEITIDGSTDDWGDALTPAKASRLLASIRNDGQYIYLCLVPLRRELGIQMLMQGFTVWLDSTGRHEKVLGVRYPIGGPPIRTARMEDRKPALEKRIEKRLAEMELLQPKIFGRERVMTGQLAGVKAAVRIEDERLVYELQFPLKDPGVHPYFLSARPGSWISLGLELNKNEPVGRAGGGFSGGMRGGGPAGMDGGPAGARGARFEPGKFELWLKAKLANAVD